MGTLDRTLDVHALRIHSTPSVPQTAPPTLDRTLDVHALRIHSTPSVLQTASPTLDRTLGVHALKILSIQSVLLIVICTQDRIPDVPAPRILLILNVLQIVTNLVRMIRAANQIVSGNLSLKSVNTFVMIILMIRFVKGWNCLDSMARKTEGRARASARAWPSGSPWRPQISRISQ